MTYSQPFYILAQIFPQSKTLKVSSSITEINNYIITNLSNLGFKNHKEQWIEQHCKEKDRHILEVWNDNGSLTDAFIVVKLYKFI
jgi:DNA-directed RNA polymerase specialized sigma54-like protein